MHSVPERHNKDDRRSRYEQYGAGTPYTCLPDVDDCEYLTDAFLLLGLCEAGAAGAIPVTWKEVTAFNVAQAGAYNSWDMTQLVLMSRAYCSWLSKGGKQKDAPEDVPYINRTEETMANLSAHLVKMRDKAHEKYENTKPGMRIE